MTRTAIVGARIFDGEEVIPETSVVIEGTRIVSIGGEVPDGAVVVDGRGGTLMPGLIDAHVHTSLEGLELALTFGVTTELEMQGMFTRVARTQVTENDRVADVRSAGFGITPPGGHPSELMGDGGHDDGDEAPWKAEGAAADQWADIVMPFATTPEEAVAFIPRLEATGSDYIKFMIDDGTVEGAPGLPLLDDATIAAGVAEAHRRGLLTVAHTLTVDATASAIAGGIDGLVHLFMDRPHTPQIIEAVAASGAFVVPCVVLNASMMGIPATAFAADPRVRSKLDDAWIATLESSYDRYPQGDLDDVLASVRALHAAGVDILVGTDVSFPLPALGGMAHGASVHHELQLLVRAGLTPTEALRAATATPSRRFGLDDRGRIRESLRADLVLVDGDPTTRISDTLGIRQVWRRGSALLPS
ncbi:amidohydrolase family protein [Leifsonia aquatica]|uniref:Amidohydrolase family protein n=2 Tax=Leifsonia aquatica TaxID=144185 RepID=U2T931_LEIAQ|nr:amidohydrolase family protein [Leifsonia aquatica]ERK71212.1 amidohydrolase family protein [Leifsonia aquatica ATCC 14665]MBB2968604.1 imidazolonepropionase-like amidohydrolase [Leifsonia aquatica]